ncbi:LptA/OstA family protein [Deinococcus petrolearius]|uniref:LptA/OstA family protein n=1 Tax=Deinococcus petrolearius TaxID=1751295 RepID=A0ABW1DM01_9DEIO
MKRSAALTLALTLGAAPLLWPVLAQSTAGQSTPGQATPAQSAPAQTVPAPLAPLPPGAPPARTAPRQPPEQAAPEAATTAPADPAQAVADAPTEHERAGRCVEGSEQSCLALVRQGKDGQERRILVIRTGTSDDTGIYTVCGPRDGDPEGTPNIGVFSETGVGGVRVVIDKNVVRVPLAVVTNRPPAEGQEGSDGRVEASAGTARFLDAAPEGGTDRLGACGVEALPKPAPDTVLVTQGKTSLRGQDLVYDETDGVARIAGPIRFTRDNAEQPLSGSSERIEVDVDAERTLLVGKVELKSEGGRVSRAPRVEYDDAANTARLYATGGEPAESTRGTDVLRVTSGYILYNLDSSDVVVFSDEGNQISGEFQDGESAAPASTPPASQPRTTPTPP